MKVFPKTYIGDGAYVEGEGWNITLTTSNGLTDTNRVVLEDAVLKSFLNILVQQGIIKEYKLD